MIVGIELKNQTVIDSSLSYLPAACRVAEKRAIIKQVTSGKESPACYSPDSVYQRIRDCGAFGRDLAAERGSRIRFRRSATGA
jgi:hypothetical protein